MLHRIRISFWTFSIGNRSFGLSNKICLPMVKKVIKNSMAAICIRLLCADFSDVFQVILRNALSEPSNARLYDWFILPCGLLCLCRKTLIPLLSSLFIRTEQISKIFFNGSIDYHHHRSADSVNLSSKL